MPKSKTALPNKRTPFSTYVWLLLLSFWLTLTWGFTAEKSILANYNGSSNGGVLGDDDEDEQEKDDEHEDEQDDDQDDDRDEDREDENESEDPNDEDGEDAEDKVENQRESSKTRETIINPNGTRTVVKKESEGKKSETEITVYDQEGRKIEERKIKMEDGNESKVEIKTFGAAGGKLSEMKFKTEDDGGIKLEIKDEDNEKTFVRYDEEHNEVKVRNQSGIESDSEMTLRVGDEENEFELEVEDDIAQVKFPITISDDDGKVYVTTGNGLKRVVYLPDQAAKAVENKIANAKLTKIELKENEDKLEYEITAEKAERLFGLINVNIPLLMQYDATTGELTYSTSDFRTSLLDSLSF